MYYTVMRRGVAAQEVVFALAVGNNGGHVDVSLDLFLDDVTWHYAFYSKNRVVPIERVPIAVRSSMRIKEDDALYRYVIIDNVNPDQNFWMITYRSGK